VEKEQGYVFKRLAGGEMKTVLVCGSEGYIGHALVLRLIKEGYKVVGIDNFSRTDNVMGLDAYSATPIHIDTKAPTYLFNANSIMDYRGLLRLIIEYDPSVIINLAQQPSAPWSHKSRDNCISTTYNNLLGTINVLYAIHETGIDTQLIQIGSMGEYDPQLGFPIPEGVFDHVTCVDGILKSSTETIFPRRPGSWYHASKVASTYYIDCACRWWGINATDIMQGIVYGMYTPEIDESKSYTRLDSDECFGTVVHRFVIQAILGEPLTIYGKGKHKRGFIALNDSIQALMLAIENPGKGYRTWNQLSDVRSINSIADTVLTAAKERGLKSPGKQFIDTPRKEVTDEHYYNPVVENLKELGFKPTRNLGEEIHYMFKTLLPHKERLEGLRKVVMPRIKW
jgi:UDP-sulfoquinovose synthase